MSQFFNLSQIVITIMTLSAYVYRLMRVLILFLLYSILNIPIALVPHLIRKM
ncbi:unnamed protein product [Schistosoma margrebowiei]|uniref:Uncharacterized protein n=1 Tax=Schistosoma margrebowiei TaxID=48269 RepID=A0A183MBV2_9TREM|nr:unnamed protein product [Schistosoma margrebowiei]